MGISATASFKLLVDPARFTEERLRGPVHDAVQASCGLVEASAKEYCPVKTGALQASITSSVEDLSTGSRGTIGPHMDYAAYVEFGTGARGAGSPGAGPGPYGSQPGMPAQPYMRPALDENKDNVLDIFQTQIGEALNA